jgi:hypothetical protein
VSNPRDVISTILEHDAKITSYKLALLRSINDVVLSFPDLATDCRDVAIPLRSLAEFWVAYYWPICDPAAPIAQGQRAQRTLAPYINDQCPRCEATEQTICWGREASRSSTRVCEICIRRGRYTSGQE